MSELSSSPSKEMSMASETPATRDRKRILYVIGSLDSGGSERHLALITPALRKLGWEPQIFCLSHRGVHADEVERQGVRVIALTRNRSSSRIVRSLALPISCIRLFATISTRRPHIIHFFLPMSYIIGAPISILMRVPVRVMSRRSLNRYQSQYPLVSAVERHLHRYMTRVLGNSRSVVEELKREGCRTHQVKLIYNGTDLDAYATGDSVIESTLGRPELVLIIVANLIPYKGHADLIWALAKVHTALPPDWELWCVGRDDGLLSDLNTLAAAQGVGTNIKFLGSRTDIPSLLKAADIGILCSHEEGFSNAIIEGMAAGLPMVVTDVGGNAEAVLDGQTGIVVRAKDPDALGNAVLELAADPERRRAMGKEGRRRAQEHFTLARCVQEYSDLYEELLKPDSTKLADEDQVPDIG